MKAGEVYTLIAMGSTGSQSTISPFTVLQLQDRDLQVTSESPSTEPQTVEKIPLWAYIAPPAAFAVSAILTSLLAWRFCRNSPDKYSEIINKKDLVFKI